MAKTVVVLGAGPAGLPLAHYLVRRAAQQETELRVVLVSPQSHFYWSLASVRFVLPETQHSMTEAQYLIPIADQFAQYPYKDRFRFVLGAATALHPDRNSVTVTLNKDSSKSDANSAEEEITYHTLIIATGTSYSTGVPWKAVGTTQDVRAAIAQLRSDIEQAQTIVVAGAGATGVEFAGELGAAYGSKPKNKKNKKQITLLSVDALPLEPRLLDRVRTTALSELRKLGVEVVANAHVVSTSDKEGEGEGRDGALGKQKGKENTKSRGKTQITIEQTPAGGSKSTRTFAADLFIPTYSAVYNSFFAPPDMLTASGRFLQGRDLRAPGHANIFVVGDAGSQQEPQLIYAERQTRHVMGQLDSYFASGGAAVAPYPEAAGGGEGGADKEKIEFGITVGPDRGTGQVGGWRVPGLMIWWYKGRRLGTDVAPGYAAGTRSGTGPWPR
ncbi:FAD/NAD(P)-binding domain-containing protein [Hypoxylon sp. NC1633]|nr:FAD/NAD(P)-binding domain-containing protein [Hypoxylon sp. NC1633]